MTDREVPAVNQAHIDAVRELTETGHLFGEWMPKSRRQKYRMCMVKSCRVVEVMDVVA